MDTQTIIKLAQARAKRAAAKEALDALMDAFTQSTPYDQASIALAYAKADEAQAEADFRTDALAAYGRDQEKHTPAYDIRMEAKITIPDEGAAIRWCITNFTPALTLNRKVFDASIGAIPADVAFVIPTPKVFIKGDLSEWLKEESHD